jgi:hypothetical protein
MEEDKNGTANVIGEGRKMYTEFWLVDLKKTDHLETYAYLGRDGRWEDMGWIHLVPDTHKSVFMRKVMKLCDP